MPGTVLMSPPEQASRQLKSGFAPEVVIRNLVQVGLSNAQAQNLVADLRAGKIKLTPASQPNERVLSAVGGMFNFDTIGGLASLALGVGLMYLVGHRHTHSYLGFRLAGGLLVLGLWRTCAGILKKD